MSAADRPWWASAEDDAGPGPDVADDPLVAHRAARRGRPTDDGTTDEAPDTPDAPDAPDARASDRSRRDPPADDGSWWVPATEAVTRLARDLAASTLASPPPGPGAEHRRTPDDPAGEPGDADGRAAVGDRAPDDRGAEEPSGSGGPGRGHRIDACGVCPICVGLRALGEARPELVGHLTEAARHLALAVRTVVDASASADEAAEPPGASRPGGGGRHGAEGLHRIDLDD